MASKISFPYKADVVEANELLRQIAEDLNNLNAAANEFADEVDACDTYDDFVKGWRGPYGTFKLTPRAATYKAVLAYVVKVRVQTSEEADALATKIAGRLNVTNVSGDWEHEESYVDSVEET
jgi:hypothetical protein